MGWAEENNNPSEGPLIKVTLWWLPEKGTPVPVYQQLIWVLNPTAVLKAFHSKGPQCIIKIKDFSTKPPQRPLLSYQSLVTTAEPIWLNSEWLFSKEENTGICFLISQLLSLLPYATVHYLVNKKFHKCSNCALRNHLGTTTQEVWLMDRGTGCFFFPHPMYENFLLKM